jgi:hypothetical protein
MNHCLLCNHRLWPWQGQGHFVQADGSLMRWHGTCWVAARLDSLNAITAKRARPHNVRATIGIH